MTRDSSYYLRLLKRKYLLLRTGEGLLWSGAFAVLLYSLLLFFSINKDLIIFLVLTACFFVFIAYCFKQKLFFIRESDLVKFINKWYPGMEASADLLLRKKEALTPLQQLQYERTVKRFGEYYPAIRFPHHLGSATVALVIGVATSVILSSFRPVWDTGKKRINDENANPPVRSSVSVPAVVQRLEIEIIPPFYTGLPHTATENPALKIVEGTSVTWSINFSKEVEEASLLFGRADSLKLSSKKNTNFTAKKSFWHSDFYQVEWRDVKGKRNSSDYFKIEVTKDQPPQIKIVDLPQFQELSWQDNHFVKIHSSLTDDYGLQSAHVIATVSKGSGESVKFREEKIRFTTPHKIFGKNINAALTLDLHKLGMSPGDELYFYVEALDNKHPIPNRSRTETYFIAVQDTASQELSFEGGLGVDLMPEYFRSQRQIIIDSEKLLKEKKAIEKGEFNARSNGLAHDQKVLRLKYGEFLGEEFESGIALETESHEEQEQDEEEDVTEKFGHVHDKDNEHNLVEEGKAERPSMHEHEHPEEKEDPLETFVHMHDDPEEATFFIQSVRAKLKAALTIMWDAELHLRLYDPQRSLPYQYRALKLLKEISNDSRIYVHKTGFDAPPIKEDKRLTGDLTEIRTHATRVLHHLKQGHATLREGLKVTEALLQMDSVIVSSADKKTLTAAAGILSTLALEYPAQYLHSLSIIKNINEDQVKAEQIKIQLMMLRRTLWQALPNEVSSPGKETRARHFLDKAFIDQIKEERHE